MPVASPRDGGAERVVEVAAPRCDHRLRRGINVRAPLPGRTSPPRARSRKTLPRRLGATVAEVVDTCGLSRHVVDVSGIGSYQRVNNRRRTSGVGSGAPSSSTVAPRLIL